MDQQHRAAETERHSHSQSPAEHAVTATAHYTNHVDSGDSAGPLSGYHIYSPERELAEREKNHYGATMEEINYTGTADSSSGSRTATTPMNGKVDVDFRGLPMEGSGHLVPLHQHDQKVPAAHGALSSGREREGGELEASLDHRPVALSWENVGVWVKEKSKKKKKKGVQNWAEERLDAEQGQGPTTPVKKGHKRIIHGVSGVVQPGSLVAIMGASGAGKSTLMNVLANRNVKDYKLEGDIKVNGLSVGSGIRNISAYVQQNEMFFSTLTVRETLTFRALLHMDQRISKKLRLQRVEEVMQEMGLMKCANTKVGQAGTKRGISGGEAKRLSFACEMLTNPRLMFCDEPTSGLDTFMAQNIVQTLQNMAQKNRTILCTIHQPSSEIFALFDRVLLLAEGRVAFMGKSSVAVDFFRRLDYSCPNNFNPADFYILTLAIVPGKEPECRNKVKSICDAFSDTEVAQEMRQHIGELNAHGKENTVILEEAFASGSRLEAGWGQQFASVLWRSWINLMRDVVLFRVRVMQTLFMALLLGLIYLRMDYDQKGVMNINGAMFLVLINISFSTMFSVINSFPNELPIFLREYGSGLYRTDVYFLAKNLAELPSFIILPLIYAAITYWMMGLNDSWQSFLIAAGIITLVANTAVSFGLTISSLAGTVNLAVAIAPVTIVPFMMFGGFFLNSGTVPVYFLWLKYLSWFNYANELMAVNQWQDVSVIECPANGTRCQYQSGADVLEYVSFTADNNVLNYSLLAVLLVGFRLISFVVLLIRARRSKA